MTDRKRRVILLEDNDDHAELMSYYFKKGCPEIDINRFDSGEEFLDRTPELDPKEIELILLDVKLPGLSGLEVVRELDSRKLFPFTHPN